MKSSSGRLCSGIISSPVDLEYLSHRLPSINWWSSQREKNNIQGNQTSKGKLEPKRFYHAIRYTFTVQYAYIIQACYDLPINTLRLDSTHSDTYNLVEFSGCLHLWWIPLLTPELCVNKSQSALCETNWLLRVSGCNPYLESLPNYIDGAPPWTPTNMGYGITSRPLKHDPEISPRDSKELCTDHILYIFKQTVIFIMLINLMPTFIIHPHTCSLLNPFQIILPNSWI